MAELLAVVGEADWIHGATALMAILSLAVGLVIGAVKSWKIAQLEVEAKRMEIEAKRIDRGRERDR